MLKNNLLLKKIRVIPIPAAEYFGLREKTWQ